MDRWGLLDSDIADCDHAKRQRAAVVAVSVFFALNCRRIGK
jgi:hypothetical protein